MAHHWGEVFGIIALVIAVAVVVVSSSVAASGGHGSGRHSLSGGRETLASSVSAPVRAMRDDDGDLGSREHQRRRHQAAGHVEEWATPL